MFVVLNVKRGWSGRSCMVAEPNRARRYHPARASAGVLPGIAPENTLGTSMLLPARSNRGWATGSSEAATPSDPKSSSDHLVASTPAVIDPPETDDTRALTESKPASLRRWSAPRWNNMARYPPPLRHIAIP